MSFYASTFVNQAESWLGVKEGSAKHKEIIDLYNSHKPLARGYKMTYEDAWCVAFVSAVSIAVGFTSIVPTEVGCSKMIEKFKALGVWRENEDYKPRVGDIVFYDWEDDGNGDNKGTPNHVGIVRKVLNGSFEVIEGNKNNAVGIRTMSINGKQLRGFAIPKYDSEDSETEVKNMQTYTVKRGDSLGKIAAAFNVSVSSILEANGNLITDANKINTGWVIKIPYSEAANDPSHDYEELGRAFRTALEDVNQLESVKRLKSLI